MRNNQKPSFHLWKRRWRRGQSPLRLLKSKKLWMILFGFLGVFGIGYILLFTSSQPELMAQSSPNSVRIVGNPMNYQKSIRSAGISGSKELCWQTPECKQIHEKFKKEGWPPLENLSDIEKNCIFAECLPPPDSPWGGERETITLSLNGDQIAQLIAIYSLQDNKVRNVTVDIKEGVFRFQGVSSYVFLPGKITGALVYENYRYQLRSLYAGRIPVPQRIQTSIEGELDGIIIDILAGYGVHLDSVKIENDKLIVTAEIRKGLVKVEGDTLVINLEILPTPIPEKPGEYKIQ